MLEVILRSIAGLSVLGAMAYTMALALCRWVK